MSMGARLARERRNQNLTQEQLAEQLGVTRQAVSRWESDTAYPETDKILRMAALFNVSCDYLLGVSEEKRGDKPPSPVTRLLREAAGRRVQLAFYEEDDFVFCDYARILDFDGGWADVEFVREKRGKAKKPGPLSLNTAQPIPEGKRETRLIPLSSIRTITILPDGGEA